MGRYDNLKVLKNSSEIYESFFVDRMVNFINQYGSQDLNYPSQKQVNQLKFIEHVWAQHDRYWRLSEKHYGDPNYWWVIAFFNQKPTESDVVIGETIIVPLPLERILFFIEG